jgi:hypothetical protein
VNSSTEKFRGPSCEIVSDLHPKSFSHDWHVQPSCQRPNRPPPERRVFSPVGGRTEAPSTVLETLQTYRARESPVNAYIPQNFHHFSTTEILDGGQQNQISEPQSLPIEANFSSAASSRTLFWLDPDLTPRAHCRARSGMAFRPEKRSFQRMALQAKQRRKTEN